MHNFEEEILNSTAHMGDYTSCPLHWIVFSDDYYRQLESRLKDPNERDLEGNTLLHLAAQSPGNNSRIILLLIEKGADVNAANPAGHTALQFAVASRKRDAVHFLIEAGAHVNAEDSIGRTALHFAVCKANSNRPYPVMPAEFDIWILERLLCHPEINLNHTDPMKETPLMWAVKERNPEAVGALLKKGANPDIPRLLDDRTALHEALYARDPNIGIMSALLTHGAGIYCKDVLRKTAVDILVRNALAGSDDTLLLAKRALMLIAFRYHVRKSLWHTLERTPDLYNFLKECCKEVTSMRRLVIFDSVTLHDFCLDCFQTRFGDPVAEIFKPAVEMLISEMFPIYCDFIYGRLSRSDLSGVLEITVGRSFVLDMVPNGASTESILFVIRRVYGHSDELKRHLLGFKHLLGGSFDAS